MADGGPIHAGRLALSFRFVGDFVGDVGVAVGALVVGEGLGPSVVGASVVGLGVGFKVGGGVGPAGMMRTSWQPAIVGGRSRCV